MFKIVNILMSALFAALSGFISLSYAAALSPTIMTNNAAIPPSVINEADPNVMINLSIETPMQGAAYNDENDGGSCTGRVSNDGTCYFTNKDYLGYFNSRLCYDYDSGNNRFNPAGPSNADHSCNGVAGGWSGNFLNWATMTAIDEFRWSLTGGHRSTDTATTTVLERGYMLLNPANDTQGHNWFPYKRIGSTVNVAPNTVTPYNNANLYIHNYDTRFSISSNSSNKRSGNVVSDLFARALVCEGTQETASNTYRTCKQYGVNLKPEGLIQKNSANMRFAVMSYLRDSSANRHGGVLRANMKYVGKFRPVAGGGVVPNTPGQEFSDVDGTFFVNPDPADATASGVANSGVINYINKFGANGYKGLDPIGELFYECLNYYKGRGPTTEFAAGASAAALDGFPAISNWVDPIQHQCQQNYIVGINDANPWYDKRLPGTDITSQTPAAYGYTFNGGSEDWGEPTNPDTIINVTTQTNLVGAMQGINGTSRNIGCVPGNCDMNNTSKTIANLGQAFGTPPYTPKQNSYYIAGLAYYAASNDIRTEATLPGMQTVQTFMIDTQEYNATPLTGEMNMLWLAGKYGGFNEKDFVTTTENPSNTYQPNDPDEWDEDGDGVPDNYVLANDPAKLVTGLTRAFSNIEERISSGSAAAVVSDGITGTGAFYQAVYSPKVSNSAGQEVRWVGQLHSLFVDPVGRLREDGDGDAVLDDIATDNIVQLRYNPTPPTGAPRTMVFRYDTQAAYIAGTPTSFAEIDDLNAIWKAREQLASLENSTIENQRNPYTNTISTSGASRYIFTWKDTDADGVVDVSEVNTPADVAFTAANMNEHIMAVANDAEADKVVAFIRGKEDDSIPGYRSRTIDYDGDGTDEAWRLGDIVHSSPIAVSEPGEAYDLLKGDPTYTAYRTQYKTRRQVVYVGGNDGMLHAFNGGFFNQSSNSFELTRALEASYETSAPTSHPLGAELWAYVPANLLPHMQWLKELSYPHLYYVDGSPQAYDVNIFPTTGDTDHPNGWGTILVVNMRFGGGAVTYDHDGDGGSTTPDITARSAVVVLDITNPEKPPTLLAEISDANLGFTTSKPSLVVQRAPSSGNNWNSPTTNDWYLVFGSGPIGSNALSQVTSDQNARMYVYDLTQKQFVQFAGNDYMDLGIANAFVGDSASMNWDTDFMDDAVYYGTVSGDVLNPTGGLYRIPLYSATFNSPSLLLSPITNQPFSTAPSFTIDPSGDHWVYAGTGRLYVNADNQSETQQTFYGVKEPGSGSTWGQVLVSDMQETTGLKVFSLGDMQDNGPLWDPGEVIPGGVLSPPITDTVDNSDFTRFRNYMATKDGWFIDLKLPATAPRNSTRNIFSSITFRSFVIFPEYTPPLDQCVPEGTSRLYALFFETGTAFPGFGLGAAVPTNFNNDGDVETAGVTQSIQGIVSTPMVYQRQGTPPDGGSGKIIACASTAACTDNDLEPVPTAGGRRSWREITLQ